MVSGELCFQITTKINLKKQRKEEGGRLEARRAWVSVALLFFSIAPGCGAEALSELWTEAVQFRGQLIPREASSAGRPIEEDIFFDGPFLFRKESGEDLSKSGFEALARLDDGEAMRAFRTWAIQSPDEMSSPAQCSLWVGMAVANWDAPSRATYFLNLATRSAEGATEREWCQYLRAGLLDEGDVTDDWIELAIHAEDWRIAVTLLRHLLSRSEKTGAVEKIAEATNRLVKAFPELEQKTVMESSPLWRRFAAEKSLQKGDITAGAGHLVAALDLEQKRLQSFHELMPEASLNLGETSGRLLQLLLDKGAFKQGSALATSLMSLPRDPYHKRKTIRTVPQEDSAWRVGRRFLAEIAMSQGRWQDLSSLPQGYDSSEKAEWIFWQLIASKEAGKESDSWMEALRKEPEGSALVLQALTYQPGKMEKTTSEGSVPLSKAASQLVETPTLTASPFTLLDWEEKKVSLESFAGEPVLVIFFLGGECLHCVEQLHAFGPRTPDFTQAGIPIVAVSTDPVSALAQTLSSDETRAASFPFPIISNEKLDVFQEWGAIDQFTGKPIHGTYLVDPTGEIIWMAKGNDPYMEPEFLLEEATRQLSLKSGK